jgi:hypothetical protein
VCSARWRAAAAWPREGVAQVRAIDGHCAAFSRDASTMRTRVAAAAARPAPRRAPWPNCDQVDPVGAARLARVNVAQDVTFCRKPVIACPA